MIPGVIYAAAVVGAGVYLVGHGKIAELGKAVFLAAAIVLLFGLAGYE